MSVSLFEDIQAFIVEKIGVDEVEVTQEALLQNDLGIYGDDAVDLIVEFGKKFKVDVSNFMAADYFKPEGLDILGLFSKGKSMKALTVGHLEKAVIAGRLDEEVINS
jgi:acyl carrier protein